MSTGYGIWSKSFKKKTWGNFEANKLTESLSFCILPQKHRTTMNKENILDCKVNDTPRYPPDGKVSSFRNPDILLPPFL